MDTLFALCILGFFMLMLLMMFMMMMRGMARASSYPPGGVGTPGGGMEPTYDDPDIESRGGFGRPSTTYDDPDIESSGSFGRPRTSGSSGSGGFTFRRPGSGGSIFGGRRSSGRTDNPDISSRGSFGRKRK